MLKEYHGESHRKTSRLAVLAFHYLIIIIIIYELKMTLIGVQELYIKKNNDCNFGISMLILVLISIKISLYRFFFFFRLFPSVMLTINQVITTVVYKHTPQAKSLVAKSNLYNRKTKQN